MKKINYTILIIIVHLMGCEKFVDIDPPQDQMVTKTVFSSDETAISALTGLYANMMRLNFPLPYILASNTGLYSDELEYQFTDIIRLSVYRNALNAKDAPTNAIWTNVYNFIYQANSIIEGVSQSNNITEPIKKQLRGEALFLRGFWYFYLLNLYGEVPLVLSTDYLESSKLERTNSEFVGKQIVEDLKLSKTLVSENYVAGNSISETTDRVRPNKYVVAALLARVYLYQKNWKDAESEANYIIRNPLFQIEPDSTAFKGHSKEAIWQLRMPEPFLNTTYEAYYSTLSIRPATGSRNNNTISNHLLVQFDDDDLRRINWIGVYVDSTVTPNVNYYLPRKYKTEGNTINDEHSIVFRLAETYLIRAEARAQLDNLSVAIDDLDKIKERAGIPLIKQTNPGLSKIQLLSEILSERNRELFCEWGHRWLDLKRTGNVENVMSIVTPQKGGIWSPDWLVWPIPLNDVNNSNNIIQNNGYN